MRIIAGRLGGRRLATVHGPIRPTAALVREAVFNILGDAVLEARVLDLFAGTGALGIEAWSRGARSVTFVEQNRAAFQILKKNLKNFGLLEVGRIMPRWVSQGLKQLQARKERFDLVFLDPPYGRGLGASTMDLLARSGVVEAGGWVVLEHDRREQLTAQYSTLTQTDQRFYGETMISFYRYLESPYSLTPNL